MSELKIRPTISMLTRVAYLKDIERLEKARKQGVQDYEKLKSQLDKEYQRSQNLVSILLLVLLSIVAFSIAVLVFGQIR